MEELEGAILTFPASPSTSSPAHHRPAVAELSSVSNVRKMVARLEDHACLDEVDVKRLNSLGDGDIADMQDNRTDDDPADLETDDSFGEKSKIKLDISMEGLTEHTDITTPVEMGLESAMSKRDDFDTSYQISDLPIESTFRQDVPEIYQKEKSETLFNITDLDDLTDVEESTMHKDGFVSLTSYSDHTLVAEQDDVSPRYVEAKIKLREEKIEEKFERMSISMSEADKTDVGEEEFERLSTSIISHEEEEQAALSFDQIIFDNYAEDKSEDWLTHGSDPSPEKDLPDNIFDLHDREGIFLALEDIE